MSTFLINIRIKYAIAFCVFVLAAGLAQAQILKDLGRRVEQKAKDRANRKVDKAIDKGLDKAEGAADGSGNKKGQGDNNTNNNGGGDEDGGVTDGGGNKKGVTGETAYKGKFDFIPGEKIVAFEDFTQDNIGDFPARWNTNSTGELVNIDGKPGKWLMLNKEGVFTPEFVNGLPENFTLEMDVACNKDFSYYSSAFAIAMASLKSPKDFTNWKQFSTSGRNGTNVWVHPMDAGGSRGYSGYEAWTNGASEMKNEASSSLFHGKSKTSVHVSIWRQKQRLRVYMDAEKVWDIPKGFDASIKYNTIVFGLAGFWTEADRYFVSNIRLAVGAPDTRNKLITTGKFVTSGILFDVNSDRIKPESYGMIKEIANVLKENADVRVKIIGHTDSDGDDAKNLDLSKKRAAAVKKSLSSDFGVDDSRIETDGKGEGQPAVKNDTPENKAQNRRVEFVKL